MTVSGACSSILHLENRIVRSVLKKMANALRPDGWIYTSFNMESMKDAKQQIFHGFHWSSFQRFIRDTESLSIAESLGDR